MSDWGASLNLPTGSVSAAAEQGLRVAAAAILAAAKEGAPVLTGELRDSGSVAVDGTTAAVGFSDSKAVAAHENMHDRLRNGKRAKFLELALQENSGEAVRALAEALKRALS